MSESQPQPKTLVYKRASNVDINLDLYVPASAKNVPVLLWFHGGGLLMGTRSNVFPHLLRGVEKHGYALVSADYRLAPQVTAAEILSDVTDCIDYVRNDLLKAANVDSATIDVSKLAVSGSSAGGYLAFLAGLNASPPPNVLLPIYAITDPYGKFFTTPQPHPFGTIDKDQLAPFLDPKAEVMSGSSMESYRLKMYPYMMEQANLAELLSVKASDSKFRIAKAIEEKGGNGGLPPVYVVHGDADRVVGVEQSDEVVEVLKKMGATVEYERLKGMDHLFDMKEDVHLDGMYAFVKKHI